MEKKYSWSVLERKLPPNRIKIHSSIIRESMPDLLVFKPIFMPDPDLYAQEILNISSKTIDTKDWLYQGQYAYDMPYGIGSMTYKKSSNYSKFFGSWFHGKLYDGTLIYKNGDSFEGLFRDG